MAAVMLQVIPSFRANFSKNKLFISAKTNEKYIVSKHNCIAHHIAQKWFLPIADITLYCWVTFKKY